MDSDTETTGRGRRLFTSFPVLFVAAVLVVLVFVALTTDGDEDTPSCPAEETEGEQCTATSEPSASGASDATSSAAGPALTTSPETGSSPVAAGSSIPSPVATATPGPTPTPIPTATPIPTPVPTPTPIPPDPVGQSSDWTIVFEDNFDTIDESVWETAWFTSSGYARPVNGLGGACFHPDQLTLVDAALEFRIDANEDPRCLLKDSSSQAAYVGALINTRESFSFTYGYAEARIFLSSSDGRLHNWPAFWHTGYDWPFTGEVDIAEGLSEGQPCAIYHWAGDAGQHLQTRYCENWEEPGGWHVFAADWQPGSITYYYDGVEVFSTTTGVTGDPHYLILDYTVRADGSGTIVPSSMIVDYVRVWQN